MSLNSVQRRYGWLTAPFRVATVLMTPERWASGVDRAATRVTRVVAFDTTALARALARVTALETIRAPLLDRSALLRRLDWHIRKTFWASLWCGIVLTELWPRRRAPIPEVEKPIRLVSAPETYDDFKAPTLVFPDDVPRAEKSLGARVGTQVVHLLQDLYPIVSTHQAEASCDPRERFDNAYSLPYRLTRDKPRWHSDLVTATRDGNLLGALAVGGPFAKLLQRGQRDSNEYMIDLEYLRNYPAREGLCHLGVRILYTLRGQQLVVSGIRYDGDLVTPQHARWEITERIAQAALVTHLTVWRQGMEYHAGGLSPVPVLTHNYLPPAHPLRRLLAPHLTRWMTTSLHTHVTLRRHGFDVTGFAFPSDVILRYYDDGAAAFDIARLDVERDASSRGIPESLEYPYLPQALRYYRTFERYARSYIDCYYGREDTLRVDPHVRLWFEALDGHLVRGIRPYVPDLTRETLATLCTLLMYSATVAHTENSLTDYAGFMPTTVRQDGRQQSVGEVQNTINFQLLIATPTTLLLSDTTHLALDGRGADVMRGFRRDLLEIQRDMEMQPSRYWQLFPSEIEASVSC